MNFKSHGTMTGRMTSTLGNFSEVKRMLPDNEFELTELHDEIKSLVVVQGVEYRVSVVWPDSVMHFPVDTPKSLIDFCERAVRSNHDYRYTFVFGNIETGRPEVAERGYLRRTKGRLRLPMIVSRVNSNNLRRFNISRLLWVQSKALKYETMWWCRDTVPKFSPGYFAKMIKSGEIEIRG
jgi:hypothetical protein